MSIKNDKHQRYLSQYEWDMDIKPKGKAKRNIHKKARAKYKQELHKEFTQQDIDDFLENNKELMDKLAEDD